MSMTRRTFLKITGAAAISTVALPPYTLDAAGTEPPAVRVPVLLYHNISDLVHDDYTISPSLFAAQMEWLYASGYRALTLKEAGEFLSRDAGRAVVITFDDGETSFIDYAFPLLKEYGFPATMNIIGKAVENHNRIDVQRPVISWDECRYLLASGLVELGCHSYALHIPGGVLTTSYEAIGKDLEQFQEHARKELGRPCTTLAWPYGIYDAKCIEIAHRAGFTHILTSRRGFLEKGNNMSDLPRLNVNDAFDLASFRKYLGAPW